MRKQDAAANVYEGGEVFAFFNDADNFESSAHALEAAGIRRDATNLMASHHALQAKPQEHFVTAREISGADRLPQAIFWGRQAVAEGKRLAHGLPHYVGGLGAHLTAVAAGDTRDFAATRDAAGIGIGIGIGIGSPVAGHVAKHHANFLAEQFSIGAILVTVEIWRDDREEPVISILEKTDAARVRAHRIPRYAAFDRTPMQEFDPATTGSNETRARPVPKAPAVRPRLSAPDWLGECP